jgi:uncharacterized protein with von Willebrand factor type A (vWA) domain
MEKNLECQSIKAVFTSAIESSPKFLSKSHFKNCSYESGFLLDCRGGQTSTAPVFLLLRKLRQESTRVCVRMKAFKNP